MFKTRNTLPQNVRVQSVELLDLHLAAAIDLHAQAKQAHWNVRGPGFMAVHTLFDTVSEEVERFSDMLAERVGGLGGTAGGTIQVAARQMFVFFFFYAFAFQWGFDRVFGVPESAQAAAATQVI